MAFVKEPLTIVSENTHLPYSDTSPYEVRECSLIVLAILEGTGKVRYPMVGSQQVTKKLLRNEKHFT